MTCLLIILFLFFTYGFLRLIKPFVIQNRKKVLTKNKIKREVVYNYISYHKIFNPCLVDKFHFT